MNYETVTADSFDRELKRLVKKYHSLKNEVGQLGESLAGNPVQGTPIGKDCYKIRLPVASKGKGKSGGARVITCIVALKKQVVLLSIYDKAEQENLTDKQLKQLLNDAGL